MQTFNGFQYLLINVANNFGLDKKPFDERIAWAETNLHQLETLRHIADNKPQYWKSVLAIRRAQRHEPIGHIVTLDAICSGIQVMSAITGCKAGAEATGLIKPNERSDAYTKVTHVMNEILQSKGLQVNVDRGDAKQATMTKFYGSKQTPEEIFGKDTPEIEAFQMACEIVAPGATALLGMLLDSWQPYALSHKWTLPDGFEALIRVMETVEKRIEIDELGHATFTFQYKDNVGTKTGLSNAANVVHSIDAYVLRTLIRRCNYRHDLVEHFNKVITDVLLERDLAGLKTSSDTGLKKYVDLFNSTGMADVVILNHLTDTNVHSLGSNHLRKLNKILSHMLTYKPFPLITVHDAFGAHPNNLNTVRHWYKEVMAELAESTIAQSILSEIHGCEGEFTKESYDLADLIRSSNYAIC